MAEMTITPPIVKIRKNVKLCSGCDQVLELKDNFYKAGQYWQKTCKKCHNAKRKTYAFNKVTKKKREPRPTGFKKLDKETQEKIKYDFYVKITRKKIADKYGIKYVTLTRWFNSNQIDLYDEPEEEILKVISEDETPENNLVV